MILLHYEENFRDTLWGIAKFKWSPPPFITKAAKLASVLEADIDHHLGLLKVKAGNLRGILIAVWVNLKKNDRNPTVGNFLYTTDRTFNPIQYAPLPPPPSYSFSLIHPGKTWAKR